MASHTRVLRDFGFNIPSGKTPDSLCAYAPVFRAGDSRGEWIVKRTQGPIARAQAVANWVRALAKEGVRVVTPAEGFGSSPGVNGGHSRVAMAVTFSLPRRKFGNGKACFSLPGSTRAFGPCGKTHGAGRIPGNREC